MSGFLPHLKRPIRVAVLVSENATLLDFAGPWEVFHSTLEKSPKSRTSRPSFELYTVGKTTETIRSSGMGIVPDHSFATAPIPDIVLVGAQGQEFSLSEEEWLKCRSEEGAVMASVCTGAFVFGSAGLLDGHRATTHHLFLKTLASHFPKVRTVRGTRYVRGGPRLFTAGGISSGIDLALHMVDEMFGHAKAREVASYTEYRPSAKARF